MKKTYGILPLLSLAISAAGQGLTDNKSNTNAILLNGSAITINVTEPTIQADVQKAGLFRGSRNNGYIAGLSLSGKNESGVAGLFESGELVPAARLTALAGVTFTNNAGKSRELEREQLRLRETSARERLYQLALVKDQLRKGKQDTTAVHRLIVELTETELKPVLVLEAAAAESYGKVGFYKTTAYLFGGMSAKSFTRFTGYDRVNLLNGFTTESFKGGFAGIGINQQYRNLLFGATFAYRAEDNQSLLSLRSFSYQQTTTLNNQSLTETATIKAWSGNYATLHYLTVNLDMIIDVALGDPAKPAQARNYIFINPYARIITASSRKELLPNNSNVGVGLYLFNNRSVVLGGIYAELPDIGNNMGQIAAGPPPGYRKLSVGLLTRFSLQSFLKLADL